MKVPNEHLCTHNHHLFDENAKLGPFTRHWPASGVKHVLPELSAEVLLQGCGFLYGYAAVLHYTFRRTGEKKVTQLKIQLLYHLLSCIVFLYYIYKSTRTLDN